MNIITDRQQVPRKWLGPRGILNQPVADRRDVDDLQVRAAEGPLRKSLNGNAHSPNPIRRKAYGTAIATQRAPPQAGDGPSDRARGQGQDIRWKSGPRPSAISSARAQDLRDSPLLDAARASRIATPRVLEQLETGSVGLQPTEIDLAKPTVRNFAINPARSP